MKICYFGIYDAEFGRNKVYMSGLRENGVEILECVDRSRGIIKYWNLWKKHRALRNSYDALIVGYPGHIVTPLAQLMSRKPVILDALCTLYEGEVISRGKYRFNILMKGWVMCIDWLAVKSADHVLVETEAQRQYFIKRFSVAPEKVSRIFTGVDESVFHSDVSVQKHSIFTAVFRGKFLPEAGVTHIIHAAKLLENKDVNVLILGNGYTALEVSRCMDELRPQNVTWISEHLPEDELRTKILQCHVALGQFETHQRLERTIPHKAFEALNMHMPYITGKSKGIEELLTDGVDCLFAQCGNPEDIAAKIVMLKNDSGLRNTLAKNGASLYKTTLTPKVLAQRILDIISVQR
jgi:glycosyltransferase involved in cell wall biosynthesis